MYRLFGVAFIMLVLVALLASPLPAGTLADSDDVSVVSFATPKMGRADGAEIKGLLFKPNGEGPFPALIALHGAGGIFPYQLDWARFLRENGYVVLFVDSYCARGFICEHESGDDDARRGEIMRDWQQVSVPQRVMDALGAYSVLMGKDFVKRDSIGVIGWSWGASAALFTVKLEPRNKRTNLKGVAAFYPNLQYMTQSRSWGRYDLAKPAIIFYGGRDELESAESYDLLKKEARANDSHVEIVLYPDGYRKFDEPAPVHTKSHPAVGEFTKGFNKSAFEDSKKKLLDFLKRYLGG